MNELQRIIDGPWITPDDRLHLQKVQVELTRLREECEFCQRSGKRWSEQRKRLQGEIDRLYNENAELRNEITEIREDRRLEWAAIVDPLRVRCHDAEREVVRLRGIEAVVMHGESRSDLTGI